MIEIMTSNELIVDSHLHAHWPQRYDYLHPTGSRIAVDDLSATPSRLVQTLRQNGVSHALLVQPGAYRFDNRAMLDVIAMSNGSIKALGALALNAADEEFEQLKQGGIVGLRLSLVTLDPGLFESGKMGQFLGRCRDHGLWVEVFAKCAFWPEIIPQLRRSGVKLIVEHIGWAALEAGQEQPGFQEVLELGRTSEAIVKLSVGFRISCELAPHDDLKPYMHRMVSAFGIERCIWGSDWPFANPNNGPATRSIDMKVTYAGELSSIRNWIPDQSQLHQVLWENPSRLFGFSADKALKDARIVE